MKTKKNRRTKAQMLAIKEAERQREISLKNAINGSKGGQSTWEHFDEVNRRIKILKLKRGQGRFSDKRKEIEAEIVALEERLPN